MTPAKFNNSRGATHRADYAGMHQRMGAAFSGFLARVQKEVKSRVTNQPVNTAHQ